MKSLRRSVLGAAMATAVVEQALAQTARGTARLVVPYAPGGTTDTLARLVAPGIGEGMGQTWVVENRSGASGVVGGEFVARSAPDGQILMISPALHLMARYVVKAVTYDPYLDFTPIARVAEEPYVLIANAQTVRERDLASLLTAVKLDPGLFPFAYPALGSVSHLVAAGIGRRIGVQPITVAYRGTGPAMNDLISGTVALMVAPFAPAREFIAGGRIRAIAVTTPERMPALPEVPTLSEGGFQDLAMVDWIAVWGPRGMAEAMRNRLASVIRAVVARPDVSARISGLGLRPISEQPAAFDTLLAEVKGRDERIVAEIGIMPE